MNIYKLIAPVNKYNYVNHPYLKRDLDYYSQHTDNVSNNDEFDFSGIDSVEVKSLNSNNISNKPKPAPDPQSRYKTRPPPHCPTLPPPRRAPRAPPPPAPQDVPQGESLI